MTSSLYRNPSLTSVSKRTVITFWIHHCWNPNCHWFNLGGLIGKPDIRTLDLISPHIYLNAISSANSSIGVILLLSSTTVTPPVTINCCKQSTLLKETIEIVVNLKMTAVWMISMFFLSKLLCHPFIQLWKTIFLFKNSF